MMIPWFHNDFTNSTAPLLDAVSARAISHGRICDEFECQLNTYFGSGTRLVSSGTVALWLIMLYLNQPDTRVRLGLGERRRVLVQDRSWIAVVNAARVAGLAPESIPMNGACTLIDHDALREEVSKGDVLAIVVTHMNGRYGNINEISSDCRYFGTPLIEDAAQAFACGSDGHTIGQNSFASAYSFSVTKLVSGGQGGLVVTRDSGLLEFVDRMRFQGGARISDINQPQLFSDLGFNVRYTDLLASVAMGQFSELSSRTSRVWQVHRAYSNALSCHPSVRVVPNLDGEVPIYTEALVDSRADFISYCTQSGIGVRPFYSPISSLLPSVRDTSSALQDFVSRGVYLPCGPSMSFGDLERVISIIQEYRGE